MHYGISYTINTFIKKKKKQKHKNNKKTQSLSFMLISVFIQIYKIWQQLNTSGHNKIL